MSKIVICCGGGMSSSILMKKVRDLAAERGLPDEILCYSLDMAKRHAQDADVVMLGPQVGFHKDILQRSIPGVPIHVIDMMDYGRIRATNVLDCALDIIAGKREP